MFYRVSNGGSEEIQPATLTYYLYSHGGSYGVSGSSSVGVPAAILKLYTSYQISWSAGQGSWRSVTVDGAGISSGVLYTISDAQKNNGISLSLSHGGNADSNFSGSVSISLS